MALKTPLKTIASTNKKTETKSNIKTGEKKAKKGKGRKKTGKKAKKSKRIDWADEKHFDPNRALIYIEHTEECPIFKEKAIEFQNFLQDKKPDKNFVLLRNEEKSPRTGSFEIYFSQNAKTPRELIWSGIGKGPPRKMKFPDSYQDLMPTISNVLKRIYIEPNENEEEQEPATLDIPNTAKDNAELKEESDKARKTTDNVPKKKKRLTKKPKTNIDRKDGGAEKVKLVRKKTAVACKSSQEKLKPITRKRTGKDGNLVQTSSDKTGRVLQNNTNTTTVQRKKIVAKKIIKQTSQSSTPIFTAPKKRTQLTVQTKLGLVPKKNTKKISPLTTKPRSLKLPGKSPSTKETFKRVLDAIMENVPPKK